MIGKIRRERSPDRIAVESLRARRAYSAFAEFGVVEVELTARWL
jgi:hypothetical protein